MPFQGMTLEGGPPQAADEVPQTVDEVPQGRMRSRRGG